MLKILGKSSSINVRKVLWCCAELGLSYQQEEYGSGHHATATAAFIALNPNALVPVLIDEDFVLWESNTICRYLAAREQRMDLLPAAPRARAQVEKWMDWQATELNNSWRYAFMALVRASALHRDAEAIRLSMDEWNRHMQMIEGQLLHTGAWIAGPEFTLADIVIGLSVNRWLLTPMQRPLLPALMQYHQNLKLRRGFQAHGCNGMP
jgi:glutathione S-transferase